MDDMMHKYTAGELLRWLGEIEIDEYLSPIVVEDVDGESHVSTVLNIEQLKIDFIRSVRRFEVVKRGFTFYVHDNKECRDIFAWNFTEADEEYYQNTANNVCDSLNNRTMRLIGKRPHC